MPNTARLSRPTLCQAGNSSPSSLRESVTDNVANALGSLLEQADALQAEVHQTVRPEGQGQSQAEPDAGYRPSVSTWGVFPRPSNVSKTFGGGRVHKPGDLLESAEDSRRRDEEVARLLAEYRASRGLDRTDSAEALASATEQLDAGNAFMEAGRLTMAEMRFSEAVSLVSRASNVGGSARLQWAICVDSQGRGEEAKMAYKALRSHPQDHVARKARQMLYGFQAAETMGVEDMPNFGVQTATVYAKHLNKLSTMDSWNTSYFGSGGGYAAVQSAGGVKKVNADPVSVAVAGTVLGLPMITILVLVGSRALQAV